MKVNRAAVAAALKVLRPAIATRPYVESMSHVLSSKGWLTAYDGSLAITVVMDAEFATMDACVPGEKLATTLEQFPGEEIEIKRADNALQIANGRSKIKLSVLPGADFLFEAPDWADDFPVGPDFIAGLAACLPSVGKDEAMPATLGVTVSAVNGILLMHATDNRTITRYEVSGSDAKVLQTFALPVLIPTAFCEQMVALSKTYPPAQRDDVILMCLTKDHIMADFDKALIYARRQVDFRAVDFESTVQALCPTEVMGTLMVPIPDGLEGALARAAMVLAGETAGVRITIDNEVMELNAVTKTATSQDVLGLSGWLNDVEDALKFNIDPAMFMKAARSCDSILPTPTVLALIGQRGRLLHLVSHIAR